MTVAIRAGSLIACRVHLWFGPMSLQERPLRPYPLAGAEAFQNARLMLESS